MLASRSQEPTQRSCPLNGNSRYIDNAAELWNLWKWCSWLKHTFWLSYLCLILFFVWRPHFTDLYKYPNRDKSFKKFILENIGALIDEFGISFAHALVRGHSTKQAFSAAEVAREEYFFCGPSPGMFFVYSVFIPNDLWNIPWFFAHCEIPNSLIVASDITPKLNNILFTNSELEWNYLVMTRFCSQCS